MFTDQPVTPLRLEILVKVVDELGPTCTLSRGALLGLLQPETLPDYDRDAGEPRSAAKQALGAALDLGLVTEEGGALRSAGTARERKGVGSRERVLAALDERVLSATEVEPYFANFYGYLLGLGSAAAVDTGYQEWANAYNAAVHGGVPPPNPLNATKVRGLQRWYPYAGLGWTDSGGVFHCEPFGRVQRSLPRIFSDGRRLEADTFMARLAEASPELDGGRLFRQGNPGVKTGTRVLTLGLAQALVSLHEEGVLRLHCPPDSRGWDLSAAAPPNDGTTLRSARLDAVEWPAETPNSRAHRAAAK